MGGFSLIVGKPSAERHEIETKHNLERLKQGFTRQERFELGEAVLFVYPKQATSTTNVWTCSSGNFIAVCGTFVYKSRTGAEGLNRILSDFAVNASGATPFDPLPAPIYGTYVCVIRKDGQLWIFTDRIGLYKVYLLDDRIVCSSYLLAVGLADERRPNKQAIFEYVFQGATYGDETVLESIRLLNPDRALTIEKAAVLQLQRAALIKPAFAQLGLEEHSRRITRLLDQIFDQCVEAFEGHIDTALSGGFDSRLMLAHLLARGVKPNLHVYGADSDLDVKVAKQISKSEGFPLAWVNKSDRGYDQPGGISVSEIVERNFREFDGLPPDGIFDYGVDLGTRYDRASTGALALNGGGGEIFRNFFYLPNHTFRARDIVWSFYSQFDPRAFNANHDPAEYQKRLEEKLQSVLGAEHNRLTRAEVERLYPLFRCRYWMGKNNSINNVLGYMHTPLVEPSLVEAAGAVPVNLKNGGVLAASLITQKSPRLASYDSAYGYSLDQVAPPWKRFQGMMTMYRPPWVRRWAFPVKNALKRRELNRNSDGMNPFDRVLANGFERTAEYFRPAFVREAGQRNRLRTLEYFFERYL